MLITFRYATYICRRCSPAAPFDWLRFWFLLTACGNPFLPPNHYFVFCQRSEFLHITYRESSPQPIFVRMNVLISHALTFWTFQYLFRYTFQLLGHNTRTVRLSFSFSFSNFCLSRCIVINDVWRRTIRCSYIPFHESPRKRLNFERWKAIQSSAARFSSQLLQSPQGIGKFLTSMPHESLEIRKLVSWELYVEIVW